MLSRWIESNRDYDGPTVDVVVGGQYGSEGKGAVAAAMVALYAATGPAPISVRVGGPNAGHTAVDETGKHWALRTVPVGAVASRSAYLVISAGSEIDVEVLRSEVEALDAAGFDVTNRLWIDSQATIISEHDKKAEAHLTASIGSTAKGIGAARASRLMREATLAGDIKYSELAGLTVEDRTDRLIGDLADHGHPTVIEGTQGYALGLHAGRYPYCTSGDVRAIDALAQVGISPWDPSFGVVRPWVVLRANPIRVAGNSGPLAHETTWERLGLPEEKTTVTKKIRRVGAWDPDLASESVAANGWACMVALTMVDHVDPTIAGKSNWRFTDDRMIDITATRADLPPDTQAWLDAVEGDLPYHAKIGFVGTGPASHYWI